MSEPTTRPLRVAVIGMGGFAQSHHRALATLEDAGACRVVCTCDPVPDRFADERAALRFDERKVAVHDDWERMLGVHAHELDAVTVPTPVPLHAAMHRACVERRLACYLEKPPTLFYPELQAMLAVEARASNATQVGFNFIAEGPRRALKERLLAGEFGPLRSVAFVGHWPRAASYYARAPWAGRLVVDGRPVLDSCIGNAMAHYVHNVLHWSGTDGWLSWAEPQTVAAALFRAHAIESYDTAFVRARTAEGVELRVAATHAAQGRHYQREVVVCERATITYSTHDAYRIAWADTGRDDETGGADRRDLLVENFRAYFDYLRGDAARPLTTLADAEPFVRLLGLALVASGGIADVGGENVARVKTEADTSVAINGIEDSLEAFARAGQFPAATAGVSSVADLGRLREVVDAMVKAATPGD